MQITVSAKERKKLKEAAAVGRHAIGWDYWTSRQAGALTRDIKVLPAATDHQQAGDAAGRQRGQLRNEWSDGLAVTRHQLLYIVCGWNGTAWW